MADKPTSPTAVNTSAFVSHISTNPQFTFSRQTPSRMMDKPMMASTTESAPKKPLDISNLMSPPEPPKFDSFSQGRDSASMGPTVSEVRRMGPMPPLSPPISPATKTDEHPINIMPASSPVKDPILYPSQDVTGSPQQQPLFGQDEPIDVHRIVDEHVIARPANLFRATSPPNREDYELFLYFNSRMMDPYKQDPKGWLRRERGWLLSDRRAGSRNNQFKNPKPLLPAKAPQIRKETQRTKTTKPAKVVKAAQAHAATPRPIRSYPVSGSGQPSNRVPSATPDPSQRRAVAPNREDKDFQSIADYCPPLDSLPNRPNSLKVDWKGTPIDLSNDPQRDLLHPDEIALAANLRLDCATYLTSKRRMFVRRRECLGVGKEFRKTDAQQACKIDVNKASKLWTAFEKVGWLDKHWMARYPPYQRD
ncbi:uncharacterized protein F4822DRAFT_108820 [Hypoxylon trugodes]|uniref:uncharacterized protein n=1 Tax=Hypoxylon trugodes TaxID=326681 RepID=UPI0021A1523A|nr:uncharacterized protein F4822DRAFT_108820 [Hypoxylon trugodes]KAI1391892.1 hypothetical protein F4822DRAFT_108820 [Hypoxylon trugodes]